ncbi:hypothetical protein SO802_009874 [Lithocarpus litseifolius]|uniref:Uncharacterized protein n=1 Tax=Lithocarpus litseifolius TaxID=425828 RepID=A0AAW2DEU9_9ROSI
MRETKRREDGWEMKGRLRLRSIRERRGWMGDEVIEGACEIGVLGSAFFSPCLDRSSDRRAWFGVLLAVLGSEFRLASWDRRSSRRAWIGVQIGVLGSSFFSPCLDRSFRSVPCSVLGSACSLLGSKFQSLEERRGVRWKREERSRVK